jgi:hypothetical protein
MVAMDTKKSPEVWDQLTNESGRAYEAFKVYMFMNPAERSVARTWREWTDNPEANRPSPFFEKWAREYAWHERSRAYDNYIEHIRQKGMEDAIYAEAKKQSRAQERMRGNLSEQLMNYHDKVMEFLEQVSPDGMRFSDAIAITRLYIEHIDKFGTGDEGKQADEWTEEDDEFLREAAERVRQRRMARENGGADVDEPNEDQEDSENPQNSPD